jgi:hypothetical protein
VQLGAGLHQAERPEEQKMHKKESTAARLQQGFLAAILKLRVFCFTRLAAREDTTVIN